MHGLKAMMLLQALVAGEATPGELTERLARNTGQRLSMSGVYVQLDRLERAGLVKSRLGKNQDHRGRRRRYYEISATGVQTLNTLDAARGGVTLA
ncbi:MAG: PadR family transcriptional regulator [Planctomycetota bacterium]